MLKIKRFSFIEKLRGKDPGNKQPLSLSEGERIILTSQGILKFNQNSGWQPGHLYLTNHRLVFKQVTKMKFDIALANIAQVKQTESYFVGRKKKSLYLDVHNQNNRRITMWIVVEPVLPWLRRIREHTMNMNESSLDEVFRLLDKESILILEYFFEHRYGRIVELSGFLEGMSHPEILKKINETINPASENAIGSRLLTFHRQKFDLHQGKNITFAWWLNNEIEDLRRDSLLDIFDEGDYVSVIFEIPPCDEDDIKIDVKNNMLFVSGLTSNGPYSEEVILPGEVATASFIKNYRNNILEVKLFKKEEAKI